MLNVGITKKELAELVGRGTAEKIYDKASSADAVIADEMGVCAECLQSGWLEPISCAIVKCFNCGTESLMIDGDL